MMSSLPLPTSPNPSSSASTSKSGSESGGGTLSKDALYAPLSTYSAVCRRPPQDPAASSSSSTSKKKKRHSLSIQHVGKSSSVPSLLTTLTSISGHLKSSDPAECDLYRGMGGSISRFGTGDNDRVDGNLRGVLENKLLNRSLVLVGGGVHSTRAANSARGRGGGGNGGGDAAGGGNEGGAALLAATTTSSSSGGGGGGSGRERKRRGGNGTFGCISNKRRKKILRRIETEKRRRDGRSNGETAGGSESRVRSEDDGSASVPVEDRRAREETSLDGAPAPTSSSSSSSSPNTAEDEAIGSVVSTLREMWIPYARELLAPIVGRTADNDDDDGGPSSADCERAARTLAAAERAGMHATVAECPSRRHLAGVECTVVDETSETWIVAVLAAPIGKKGETKEDKKDRSNGRTRPTTRRWKVLTVPKRGTVLEADVPWGGAFVAVRLET